MIRGRAVALSFAGLALGGGDAHAAGIVVAHDEWRGFQNAPDAATLASNVARFFTGGGPGSFVAFSNAFSLTGSMLAATMTCGGLAVQSGSRRQSEVLNPEGGSHETR